jgi:hypothetical protein
VIGTTSGQKLMVGSASTSDTSGQAMSLLFGSFDSTGTLWYKQNSLSWSSLGYGTLVLNEKDWFQLSGTIDTGVKNGR